MPHPPLKAVASTRLSSAIASATGRADGNRASWSAYSMRGSDVERSDAPFANVYSRMLRPASVVSRQEASRDDALSSVNSGPLSIALRSSAAVRPSPAPLSSPAQATAPPPDGRAPREQPALSVAKVSAITSTFDDDLANRSLELRMPAHQAAFLFEKLVETGEPSNGLLDRVGV